MRDAAAAILADDGEPLEAEVPHDVDLVLRHRALRVVRVIGQALRLAAVAVAAQIRGDDRELLGEPRRDVAPRVMRQRRTVQQQQRRAAAAFDRVDRDAAARRDVVRREPRERRQRRRRGLLCACDEPCSSSGTGRPSSEAVRSTATAVDRVGHCVRILVVLVLQAFEQRDRLGLAHGRMRREKHALGPVERRAALRVRDVEPRAVRREILDDVVRAAIRGAVNRRDAHRVHGVDVVAERVRELHGFEQRFGS